MSMFGNYKAYKQYEPVYASWKNERDILDAKRLEYLRQHPEIDRSADIKRGQTLLRAIDIMDEYSQKRAEDMEVATESVVSMGLELASFVGAGLGLVASNFKPIKNFISKFVKNTKYSDLIVHGIPMIFGGVLATLAVFPMMAWAAKAEVSASRKGRFEAMRKELDNPNAFAILTDEQTKIAQENAKYMPIDDNKKMSAKIMENIKTIKDMAIDNKEYKEQRRQFNIELMKDDAKIDEVLTPKETEQAKKDQQLLTKLVEKIDIASQDYAENAELATQSVIVAVGALGALFTFCTKSVLSKLGMKNAAKIELVVGVLSQLALVLTGIFSAQIQKQASRVGRYKVKQDLIKNPDNFVYISDEKTGEIKDVEIKTQKKENIFEFLKNAWKNNKEFEKYKETKAKEEKQFYKAIEKLDLSDEQLKDAKRFQKNTFRTFNKIDENSQKFSESIEALGQSIMYPISLIFTGIGLAFGFPYLEKSLKSKNQTEALNHMSKYFMAVILSAMPSIGINALITKEQKKASRIADMMAINEMSDYRKFR